MAEKDNTKQSDKSAEDTSMSKPASAPELNDEPIDEEKVDPVETETETDADPKTDAAVDDIMKKDGDEVLEVQDKAAEEAVVMKSGRGERFKNFVADWWASPRKRYGTIGGVVVIIAVLAGVPFTRYNVAGLVLKAPVTVQVVDSKSGAPVSGADVEIAGKTVPTEANGKAVLHVHAGSKTVKVSKKYYTGTSKKELIALSGSQNTFKVPVIALGRQVSIKVVNKITGKPLAGTAVSTQGVNVKTDAKGLATLVIASSATTQSANVSLSGYNTATVDVTAGADLAKNTFSIMPSGKLYFLSNLSGTIDVVKTNLDGTDRQTVLAGTGSEDPNSTSLLASRDWKYLALLSKRSGSNASVYLIDTTNGDKLTTIDEGNANFSLVGWSGDRFIYQVTRNTVSNWQSDQQALKSFDPTTGHTLLLDQTQASGSGQFDYTQQTFGSAYLMGDQVVYAKGWGASLNDINQLSSKQAELDTIGADGSGHKVVKTFSIGNDVQTSYVGIDARLYEPDTLHIAFDLGDNGTAYYDYHDGQITTDTSLNDDNFYSSAYPTYLLSPSGSSTFWADPRDGKNTLFVGDQNAGGQKQVASLGDYNTYGWFTDNYLLVSKNSSELYIMPASGGTPLKITDYYKPAINYNGYGGGYGGL